MTNEEREKNKTFLERTIKKLSTEEKVNLFNTLDDEGKLKGLERKTYSHIYPTRETLIHFYKELDMDGFINFISGSGYCQLKEHKFCRVNLVDRQIETFDSFSWFFDNKMGLNELNPTNFHLVDLILDTNNSYGNKKIESALKAIKSNEKEEEREDDDIGRYV